MELNEVWRQVNSIMKQEEFLRKSLEGEKAAAVKENEIATKKLNGIIAALEKDDYIGQIERGEILDPVYSKEIAESQNKINSMINSSNYLASELFNSYKNTSVQMIDHHQHAIAELIA